ncbi:hypothetical protein Tco_0475380 [Tanacetum coccineum]
MTDADIRALISRGMADALAEHEIQRKNNLNGDGSQGSESGITIPVRPTRECTYIDFLKCQPMNFKGTEGLMVNSSWIERNGDDFGQDAAHGMPWNTLIKIMTAKYCPRNEIKKLEMDYLEFKCVPKIYKLEKYVGGLPDMIHRSVMASKPKTMHDAIEFATELMDKKIRTFAERQIENKKKYAGSLPRKSFTQVQYHQNGHVASKCQQVQQGCHTGP